MLRYKILLLGVLAIATGSAFWVSKPQGSRTHQGSKSNMRIAAGEVRPTPGQLAIVDKEGKSVGLCPLQHTSVNADVAGYVARVTVNQEFHNPSTEPIEAVYTFPLPEDAAVDDMTMTIGDRVIKGKIKRREEAREIYEAAKAEGKAAALLDQERPNIFTQSVANIMPGEKVTITISYVQVLKYDEGWYEFVFPMVVGPRYTPGGGYTQPGQRGEPSPDKKVVGNPGNQSVVTDAEKITPPITPPGTRAGHDISLTVRIDAGLPLQDLRSVLHRVKTQRLDPNRAVVQLQNQKEIPNKDFILRYRAAGSETQSGMLTYAPGDGSGYFLLIIQPPLAPSQKFISPKEMVFVIDQTGSQSGWPIQKAKETMRYCIQNLNPGDTFQLIGFNTEVYPCFSKPVPNTPENVAQALKFLEGIQAGGGTDILKSVDYALRIPDDPDRLRIICYMTDGYVGNDMQIIDYVRKHRGRARMFPFGIGNSVNRFLIGGMAREGRGAAEYVTLNTPGEGPAAKFYHRIASPLLLDIGVDWNGLPVQEVYPEHIPDVFTAQPIVIKGRYTKPAEGTITIRGRLRGKPWKQQLHIVLPPLKNDGSAIATLWARERIEHLQAQDWLGAQTGNPNPEITEQIINTALEYRLMSQYTSFVAVEERVVNVEGKLRTVDVPVEMPEGVSYEGIFGEADRLERLGQPLTGQFYGKSAGGGFGGYGGGAGNLSVPSRPAPPPSFGAPAEANNSIIVRGADEAVELIKMDIHARSAIAEGTEEGLKKLAEMKPENRRAVLIATKLAPALHNLAEKVKQEGKNGSLDKPGLPKVKDGRVEVQITLNKLPADGLKQLEALGFKLATVLKPDKLLLGTLPVENLEKIIELPFIRRVAPPGYGG